ncbi:MAG: AbrB/MazE/SpoVT family DNA-binding domain-containing protein [Actinomycetota bacterium]
MAKKLKSEPDSLNVEVTNPKIFTVRLDSRNRITLPREILERKHFKPGDNISFQITQQNQVTLIHVDRPILNLSGAGTGFFENFDLAKEREFSWPD